MPTTPLWSAIAETLRGEIARGRWQAQAKLPGELALARRFGVHRHTIRRALAALAEDGLVQARRGAGVFVLGGGVDYPLGERMRFHRALAEAGHTPERRMLAVATRPADAGEATALAIAEGAAVHVYEGLSLADGVPLALVRSVFPAASLPRLPEALAAGGSITAALAASGVIDHVRRSTRVTATLASATLAAQLGVREGDPILRTTAVNVDGAGAPVEFGHAWCAGDRLTLTLAGPLIAPEAPAEAAAEDVTGR